MNPHELAALPAAGLSAHFRESLQKNDVVLTLDAFAQLELRFQRSITTVKASRKFLDDFLPLSGYPEIRSRHIDDPLAQCTARTEYLLELAGERARAQTDETTARQIVASRERGFDLVRALADAPEVGLTAGELADRLRISASNLSPLIAAFHAHGIILRDQYGKNAFLKLTPQGRALLDPSVPSKAPTRVASEQLEPNDRFGEAIPAIVSDIICQVALDVQGAPYTSSRSALANAQHVLARVEKQYSQENPEIADLVKRITAAVRRATYSAGGEKAA